MELNLEKYEATNHGDDIGFGYNLYLYSKPYGCYSCYQNPDEKRDIKIDGKTYDIASTSSANSLTVQPETGYTYQYVQNSTVFMIIGGNQTYNPYQKKVTPFPSLDPIYGAPFPLYDFAMQMTADEDIFYNKFNYVAVTNDSIHACVIAFSVFAAFFLILGIVAFTIYKVKDPKRRVNS